MNECKAAGGYGRQTHHLHVPTVLKSGDPQPAGILRACPALYRDSITTYFTVPHTALKVAILVGCKDETSHKRNLATLTKQDEI
jgi:hypothetical protein